MLVQHGGLTLTFLRQTGLGWCWGQLSLSQLSQLVTQHNCSRVSGSGSAPLLDVGETEPNW